MSSKRINKLYIYILILCMLYSCNNSVISNEIKLQDIKKHEVQYSKPIIKETDILRINTDETKMLALIEYQKDRDFEDIEAIWGATIEKNNLIKFALQKLSSPESQKRIHSSLMAKTLSALITGAAYLPALAGADSLIQSASFATGRIAQNFINKDNLPKESPLSDTELIELAGLIEDLQDEIITAYYNYKITLNKIKDLREKMLLYNKNYSNAIKNKDSMEITISGALYDEILLDEIKLINEAKNYHLEIQRLAGKDIFKKLNLCQYVYKTEIFDEEEIDYNKIFKKK